MVVFVAAGDDWSLPGRVQHHLQAGEARSPRYRSHPLLPVHPPQVNHHVHPVVVNKLMPYKSRIVVPVYCYIVFFRIDSHFYVGSMFLMRRLQWIQFCASSSDNSLQQAFLDVIQPSPLQSSSPFPGHLHHHHSLAYIFFFSSQHMPIPLQPTFLHSQILGYFSHLPILSFLILSSLATPLVHLNILVSVTFNLFTTSSCYTSLHLGDCRLASSQW